jgi:hypothetical protein
MRSATVFAVSSATHRGSVLTTDIAPNYMMFILYVALESTPYVIFIRQHPDCVP